MELYFIRHWETDRNISWMINPWDVNSSLNKNWLNQAKLAWKKIKKEGIIFDIIITSWLERTINTAKIIWQEIWFSWALYKDKDLEEKHAWVFKDYYKKQFKLEFWCNRVNDILEKFPNKTFEWVEKYEDFITRIDRSINSIKNNLEFVNKNILIISHWWVWEYLIWDKNIWNCELINISNLIK